MFAINPYLWISLELWVFLWSTTCTDHLGLSKNIVRVGKPLHRLAAVFCIFLCGFRMVFRMFFGANPQLHSLVQNMVSAAAALSQPVQRCLESG